MTAVDIDFVFFRLQLIRSSEAVRERNAAGRVQP